MSDDILDAAGRVVTKLGACGLSINAVAQDAGVSKSTVLYDHKSKSALIEAMINRQASSERERIKTAVADSADTPHPALFGRLDIARRMPNDMDKAVALALCSSVSSQEKPMKDMRAWTAADLNAMSAGKKPEAALMAYLALTGFHLTELFGFHSWSEAERDTILDRVGAIYTTHSE